jgi:hypothetical protein
LVGSGVICPPAGWIIVGLATSPCRSTSRDPCSFFVWISVGRASLYASKLRLSLTLCVMLTDTLSQL